jgi:prepilin-type N-terminal cleavage/methylation domain-containing protein
MFAHLTADRRDRSGFTLIELLMVLAIIGVLMALLVPVINSAYRKGKEAAEFTEITNLAGALQKFKDRYGVYPPSQIVLIENGNYSANNWTSICGNGEVGEDPNAEGIFLRSVSLQYLRRIWPNLVISTSGAVSYDINGDGAVNANDYYDWNQDGVLNGPWFLQGDECLVFFLGGLPTGQYLDSSGTAQRPAVTYEPKKYPPGISGFSKTPHWPMQAVVPGAGRDGPFFAEMPSDRLIDRDNDSFWELIPYRKPSIEGAYVYFSAYEGTGYRPDDLNLAKEPAPNGSATQTQNFLVLWPFPSNYPSSTLRGSGSSIDPYYVESRGPNPYTVGTPHPGTPLPTGFVVRYHKPEGFQIISPGSQVGYGHGGELPLDDKLNNRDDEDNLTNLSGSPLQDGKL